jgi:MazG family protein
MKQNYTIDDLREIMSRLRKECPWDKVQTHQSLKQYLLEETYEALETLDNEDWPQLSGELGDLLLQILFHSEIASENSRFNFDDVVHKISQKLIERHPHVFGDEKAHTAENVQENWEHTKYKTENRNSILCGVPKSAPALLQGQRLQEKAAAVGFEWERITDVIAKVDEEWAEFKDAVKKGNDSHAQEELGDFLFTVINLGRYINANSEDALRLTNEKFIRRFQYIEAQFDKDPHKMKKASLAELDAHWNKAKALGL